MTRARPLTWEARPVRRAETTAASSSNPMLKGAVKNQRQLLYFGQSLLLKEWLFFQRVKPTPWRERTVAPAIWLLFLSPSGAALVCKLAGSLCPGYTYSSLLGKSTWNVTFQKLEHFSFFCFCENAGRAASCSWCLGNDLEPNYCCSALLEQGGSKPANLKHLWCPFLQVTALLKRKSRLFWKGLFSCNVWN